MKIYPSNGLIAFEQSPTNIAYHPQGTIIPSINGDKISFIATNSQEVFFGRAFDYTEITDSNGNSFASATATIAGILPFFASQLDDSMHIAETNHLIGAFAVGTTAHSNYKYFTAGTSPANNTSRYRDDTTIAGYQGINRIQVGFINPSSGTGATGRCGYTTNEVWAVFRHPLSGISFPQTWVTPPAIYEDTMSVFFDTAFPMPNATTGDYFIFCGFGRVSPTDNPITGTLLDRVGFFMDKASLNWRFQTRVGAATTDYNTGIPYGRILKTMKTEWGVNSSGVGYAIGYINGVAVTPKITTNIPVGTTGNQMLSAMTMLVKSAGTLNCVFQSTRAVAYQPSYYSTV